MFLGLDWNTWLTFAAVVFAGLSIFITERARRAAAKDRLEANRVARYPPRRAVWDSLVEIQEILFTPPSAAGASAAQEHMMKILEAAIHIYPEDVLKFLESIRRECLVLENAYNVIEGGGSSKERSGARERKDACNDRITDLLSDARSVFAPHIDISS